MTGLLIGYARVFTDDQDLTAQRDGLARLGVEPERIYVDYVPRHIIDVLCPNPLCGRG